MIRLLAHVVIASTLLLSAASVQADEISEGLSEYSLTSWTEAAGRPLGSVYAIAQSHDGYLWIGSDAGLFRFDGWRFLPFYPESGFPVRLPSAVTVVAAKPEGGLWVAFAHAPGLYEIVDGSVRVVGDSDRALRRVTAVSRHADGTLWMIADGTLHRLRGSEWQRVQVANEGRGAARFPYLVNLRSGETGQLWVMSTEGLFRLDDRTGAFEQVAGDPKLSRDRTDAWVWDMAEAAGGSLWTTHLGSGFKQRDDAGRWRQPRLRAKGYRLLQDRDGNAWVGTIAEGVWRVSAGYGAQRWAVERMTLGTGLSSNSVQSLTEDRQGNVWVGTTAGLHRLTRHKLTPISDVGLVVSVLAVPGHGVLATTYNGLVTFHDGGRDLKAWSSSAQGLWIMRVHRDRQNSLWVGTTSGVFRSADGGHTLVPVLPDALLGSIASDRDGTVWFVAARQLYRATLDGRVARFDIPRSWGVDSVASVFGDSAGRVWLTDAAGRLAIIESAERLRPVDADRDVHARGRITAIFEDHDHAVWFGTETGLGRLVDGRFEFMVPSDGLPTDRIGAITEDDDGYIWLNVDTGLVRLARDEFVKASTSPAYRPKYMTYDASDGLSGAAIVNLSAARATDGTLWFVRGGGLTVVHPRRLLGGASDRRHATSIDMVVADDLRLPTTGDVSVPAGTKTLQITYSALELTTPQRLRFRYRLNGFDSEWITADTARQATYTNLPPGTYTFSVETKAEGEMSVDAATWGFTIQPTFTQTPWFYATMAALLIGVVYATWRIRLRVVHHQFSLVLAERMRLSREIHDTLLQSLVGLTLQIDKAVRLVRTSPTSAADQLVRMRKLAESYIRDARTSIWDLRSPILESVDLVSAFNDVGQRMVADQSVAFSTVVVGVPRRLAPKIENNLLRIGQEAIANALRHAVPTSIAVELRFDDHAVTLRVRDDGRGFTPDFKGELAGHYGLANMRDRAKELGGGVSISSMPGCGSVVEASIPLEESPGWKRTA